MHRMSPLLSLLVLAGLLTGLMPGFLSARDITLDVDMPADRVVVNLYFHDRAHLDAVAGELDIWETHPDAGYVVAAVRPAEYGWLQELGYRLEIDPDKTALLGINAPLDARYHYFDDYFPNPNGLYVVDFMHDIAAAYPGITELYNIGQGWEGEQGGYERNLWVLRITNEDPVLGPIEGKPAFVIHSEVHAREVTTPEVSMRYIRYLTSGYNGQGGYGIDADVTWLVDWHVAYVLVMVNPDGHVPNEQDINAYRRKNMNNDLCPGGNFGIDLNRNHSFFWGCCGGSSGNPCTETYRGESPASEPETYYFQDWLATVIPDQNGPNGDNELPPAAPITTTGFLLSLHSYDDSILWPWGFTSDPAPNDAELRGLARKMSSLNPYYVPKSSLYTVDGATRDWVYGKLGIPAYTVEIGPNQSGSPCHGFFPNYGCQDGIDGMPRNFWADNRPILLYAHKTTRQPYAIIHGPDAQNLAVTPNPVPQGVPVELTALIQDHRYGADPWAPVGAAEYFIGHPGADGTGIPMTPQDGYAWGGTTVWVEGTIDTSALEPGDYYILVHGRKHNTDYWGPFSAVFLTVEPPLQCDPVEILEVVTETVACAVAYSAVLSGTAPFEYDWDFGDWGASSEPAPTVDYVLPGTYAYTLTASNCYGQQSATATGFVTVECCVPPSEAALDYAPPLPLAGGPVVFTGTAVSNRPLTFAWDFGDGAVGSGEVVTHSYAMGGAYLVTLVAENECGTDTAGATVNVCTPAANADFTWTPPVPVAGDWVFFTGSADGSTPIAYSWDFGDGGYGSGKNVSRKYTAAGTYTVVMTATNCGGQTSVQTKAVTVVPEGCDPVHDVDLVWSPFTPTVGQSVAFTGTAAGTLPIIYAWDLGDGGVGSGAHVSHIYTAAGLYTVTLTAQNCGGATAQAVGLLTVAPLDCEAVQIVTVTQEAAGCAVTLAADLTGDPPFTYLWSFGDGATSALANPTHTYTQTGAYSATLDVWNCADLEHDSRAFAVEVECVAPPVWRLYLPLLLK